MSGMSQAVAMAHMAAAAAAVNPTSSTTNATAAQQQYAMLAALAAACNTNGNCSISNTVLTPTITSTDSLMAQFAAAQQQTFSNY